MSEKYRFRLGEFYCGPGGLACGALRSVSDDGRFGVIHAWANDYDLDTCETYRKNICPDSPESVIHGDVRELVIPELVYLMETVMHRRGWWFMRMRYNWSA